MKTPPDIYAENPVIDLDYKIAVMQAHLNGKTVQARPIYYNVGSVSPKGYTILPGWANYPEVDFNWTAYQYRIDPACKPQPSKIATSNNPYNLTEDQVGVKDGWRLVTIEEIKSRNTLKCPLTFDAQVWSVLGRHWLGEGVAMCSRLSTYRTQKPAGFFLPKPKVKVALTHRDFEAKPTVWFRHVRGLQSTQEFLVTSVVDQGLYFCTLYTRFADLMESEYSTDRVNWKPCYKEVEQ